jgi:hypothetical protein
MATIAEGSYVKVHCAAAGSLPAGDDKLKLRVVVLPGAAAPDDNPTLTPCATACPATPALNTANRA